MNIRNELDKTLKHLTKEDTKLHKDIIRGVFSDPALLKAIQHDDEHLYYKVQYLYDHGLLTLEDKKTLLDDLKKLHTSLKQHESLKDIEYPLRLLEEFLRHEQSYIDYTPGAQNKDYVRLRDLLHTPEQRLTVDKAPLEVRDGHIYFDGKQVMGAHVTLHPFRSTITLVGEHYTSLTGVREIYSQRSITPSTRRITNVGNDPYCYIVEPGKLNNKSDDDIRKILGAASAEAAIQVKVTLALRHVWIRVRRNAPTKFALEANRLPIEAAKPQKGYWVRINDSFDRWAA